MEDIVGIRVGEGDFYLVSYFHNDKGARSKF